MGQLCVDADVAAAPTVTGTEANACRPDNTCNDELQCVQGICYRLQAPLCPRGSLNCPCDTGDVCDTSANLACVSGLCAARIMADAPRPTDSDGGGSGLTTAMIIGIAAAACVLVMCVIAGVIIMCVCVLGERNQYAAS